jgi:hypothetical protein
VSGEDAASAAGPSLAGAKVVAYPEDRKRLLAHGEMCMPVYSGRLPEEVGRDSYRSMRDAADLMGLMLSEPIMEVDEFADCWGGRIVRVRAAVSDALSARKGAPVPGRCGPAGRGLPLVGPTW